MTWKVEFDDKARKELRKLDQQIQKKILKYLRNKIATNLNPKRFGKPLGSDKHGLWCYRIEDYRLVCKIEKEKIVVLVLRVAHRSIVYN